MSLLLVCVLGRNNVHTVQNNVHNFKNHSKSLQITQNHVQITRNHSKSLKNHSESVKTMYKSLVKPCTNHSKSLQITQKSLRITTKPCPQHTKPYPQHTMMNILFVWDIAVIWPLLAMLCCVGLWVGLVHGLFGVSVVLCWAWLSRFASICVLFGFVCSWNESMYAAPWACVNRTHTTLQRKQSISDLKCFVFAAEWRVFYLFSSAAWPGLGLPFRGFGCGPVLCAAWPRPFPWRLRE